MKVSTFYFYQTVQPFEPFNTLKWAHARSLAHSDARRPGILTWDKMPQFFCPLHRHYWHTSLHVVILEVGPSLRSNWKSLQLIVEFCQSKLVCPFREFDVAKWFEWLKWQRMPTKSPKRWQMPHCQYEGYYPIIAISNPNTLMTFIWSVLSVFAVCFAYSTAVFCAHQREMMRNSRDLPKSAWAQSQAVLNQFTNVFAAFALTQMPMLSENAEHRTLFVVMKAGCLLRLWSTWLNENRVPAISLSL